MAIERIGKDTLRLSAPVFVEGGGTSAGKKEGEGPLGAYFDAVHPDGRLGQKSWEQAECLLQREAVSFALEKAHLTPEKLQCALAGDLTNQCVCSAFAMREMGVPYLGQYGACSTMAQSLGLASLLVGAGAAAHALAVSSSHFCTAERQYRTPLEYGGQRTPTAQWTATGAGALVLGTTPSPVGVRDVLFGRIVDLGVKDQSNMGAAMAPAAAATFCRYFADTGLSPAQFDGILTGDLGAVGLQLLHTLLRREGFSDLPNLFDCGLLLFDRTRQDVHAGGSGCGCSALVMASFVLQKLQAGIFKDVLFLGTGALLSPVSSQQGASIPGIAHLVRLSHLS